MDTNGDKLEHFRSVILNDADAQSKEILRQIEEEIRRRVDVASKKLKEENERYIREEAARIKAEAGRKVSQKMMEDKRDLFIRRGEVARKIANDVIGRLKRWVETPEYGEYLHLAVKNCFKQLPEGEDAVIISCRPQDLAKVEEILARGHKRPYTVAQKESIRLGGIRLECPSKKVAVDHTLDSAFEETKGHIAEYIGLRLE
ncbi:V-type ATP synthase subunit E [Acidaminobacterium chupaoyuni]